MSPKNKKKLHILRGKLDKLDNKLIDIIKIRTNLVNEVVKLKEYKNEIVDKKRIDEISKKIVKKSIELGGNSKLLKSIWLSIIQNFIDYENKEFKKK